MWVHIRFQIVPLFWAVGVTKVERDVSLKLPDAAAAIVSLGLIT